MSYGVVRDFIANKNQNGNIRHHTNIMHTYRHICEQWLNVIIIISSFEMKIVSVILCRYKCVHIRIFVVEYITFFTVFDEFFKWLYSFGDCRICSIPYAFR